MPDLENRLPGRMLLVFALYPLVALASCQWCQGAEPAVGQLTALFPPPFLGDPTSATDIAVLFEQFFVEQARGRFRLSGSEAMGVQCLATYIAKHQARDDQGTIATALAAMTLPERLVGACAVAPEANGQLYPMVLGVAEPLSIMQMYHLINQPLGSLNAGVVLLPEPQEGR